MPKYIAKYTDLKLIDKSTYTKEVEGRRVVVPGKAIQFANGVYETTDKDEIAFLDNHPNCGNVFIKIGKEDIGKAKKGFTQTLEEKEAEKKKVEAEKEVKKKALAEGAEIPKGKGIGKKVEKPKF